MAEQTEMPGVHFETTTIGSRTVEGRVPEEGATVPTWLNLAEIATFPMMLASVMLRSIKNVPGLTDRDRESFGEVATRLTDIVQLQVGVRKIDEAVDEAIGTWHEIYEQARAVTIAEDEERADDETYQARRTAQIDRLKHMISKDKSAADTEVDEGNLDE